MTRRPREPREAETFRELWLEFRAASPAGKLKAIGGVLILLPFLAIVFLIGFFLFGGWVIFDDRIPDWVGRLFVVLVVVLVAWSFLKPVFDRWERNGRDD